MKTIVLLTAVLSLGLAACAGKPVDCKKDPSASGCPQSDSRGAAKPAAK